MRSINAVLLRLRRSARRFGFARDGNVAIIFGLALLPMLAFVGAAIDYSRANDLKADLQVALDSTALMVSKTAATMTADQIQSSAQSYFLALFQQQDAKNIQLTATYSSTGGSNVVIDGSADMDTDFMEILGLNTITITGSSTAKWGSTRLRVALVLDNTGSMASDGKINALKTATKNLLSQLKSAATVNGDVYVSIIPFVNAVNLGPENDGASWIDWTDWDAANGSDVQTCTGGGRGRGGGRKTCTTNWVPDDHNTWNGCVTDRGPPQSTGASGPSSNNYDETVTAPVSGNDVSRVSGAVLPTGSDRTELRLAGNEHARQQHEPGRQHQPTHRPGLGLAVASRRRTAQPAGHGGGLYL